MPQFEYKARVTGGVLTRGSIEAGTRSEALAQLRAADVVVVELEDAAAATAVVARAARRAGGIGRGRIGLRDRSMFCRQMAVAVGAGIPLRDAVESIAEDCDNPAFRAILASIGRQMHDGCLFSEALASVSPVFSRLFVALVRAAEEAGSMPQTLEQLADSLESQERLLRKIKSITAYPTFVAGFFTLVCLVMTVVVLPKFQNVFTGFDAELPWLTRAVFSANAALLHSLPAIVAVALGLGVSMALYIRTPRGRFWIDGLKLRLPVLGPCLRKLSVARLCRNLAIMLRGGVPVATAFEITAGVCGNAVIEQSLNAVRSRIMSGMDIASSLGAANVFPRLVVRMVGIGESSGRLPDVLDKVSESYEDEVEGSIMTATSLFEPVVICIFGMVVLVLVLAIYMPVFSVASHVK